MIPLLVMMSALTASLAISTDSTAGERERGSFEPLLVNPVPRLELVAGKWLAGVLAGAAGLVLTLVLVSAIMMRLPLHEFGFRFRFGWGDALVLLAGMLPVALLLPALQMYVATFARSFKEAQNYLGPLMLLCMAPAIINPMYPLAGKPWLWPIPMVGQYALGLGVVRGDPPSVLGFAIAALTTAAAAAVLLVMIKRLFEREKIIFGR
jgi:sodium transport system permease protein